MLPKEDMMRKLSGFLGAAVAFMGALPAGAHEPGMMGPWMANWYGMGWPWFIFMFIFWIAVLVAVIVLIRWLILSGGPRRERPSEDSAIEILKKRYARGEINKEEFEEKKKELER